jgi:aminopeptidase N
VQRRPSVLATAGALAVAAALVTAAPAAATGDPFVAGSPGLDDPFFQFAGNGGYDVKHYSLDIDYERASNHMDAEAEIEARATQNLSSFNLDLRGFDISEIEVNGRDARFSRSGVHELTVVPRWGLRRGRSFEVEIEYSGTPTEVIDPDGSSEGWVPTADGAFVVNEPQGSPGWYPANDNPMDKATYDFEVTVPAGITVIGNGRLKDKDTRRGKTTWEWVEDSPMAPYLATVTNGVFDLRVDRVGKIPLYQAVDPAVGNPTLSWERLSAEAEIIEFFSDLYGRYPFSSGGGVVDNGGVGYALESQTKSMYDVQGNPNGAPGASTVVHEVAHQWFGNAVTLSVWPDIWLNEGFARFSEWIYNERHGGTTAQQSFDTLYARPPTHPFWAIAPRGIPGPAQMFGSQPYDRGGMTLQALRVKVGDRDFFDILREWYRDNRNGNVTTADFIRLSERESRQQLDDFFNVWLFQPGKPTSW